MKRRQALFTIIGLGVGLPAALESSAQRAAKMPVIGLLDAGERLEWWAAFRQQLRELGYVEGKDITFEARYARGTSRARGSAPTHPAHEASSASASAVPYPAS